MLDVMHIIWTSDDSLPTIYITHSTYHASEGDRLTSSTQGRSVSSTRTSKPNSSVYGNSHVER